MMNSELKNLIKMKVGQLEFDLVGICRPEYEPSEHDHLLNWLNKGFHGQQDYLARNPRLRCDPRLFFPDVQSIAAVGINYYKEPNYRKAQPYISIYARGKPYQKVIRAKLQELLAYIQELEPLAKGKIAVDSSPTLDKLWAQKAGLGWRGKNTLLINKKIGSFIFLGELFLNIELEPDQPSADHCADCRKCLDKCPTGALEGPHILNASRCISYLTIEHAGDLIDPELLGNHVFGCDICQLECPFNNNIPETQVPEFQVKSNDFAGNPKDTNITEAEFETIYAGTIIKEYGFHRYNRNLKAVEDNMANM
jgi:epoxyqueuosine reductase